MPNVKLINPISKLVVVVRLSFKSRSILAIESNFQAIHKQFVYRNCNLSLRIPFDLCDR